MQGTWRGDRAFLLAQLVRLVEQFIRSDKINIIPALFRHDDLKRRLVITLNMTKVVQHIWEAIRFENTERLDPVFDRDRPLRSTGDMGTWYTGRPCARTGRSHINFWVYPGFPTPFWGLSGFCVGDSMGKSLWKLVENTQRFPRRGGRVLCVHGAVSFHRARPCATR